MSQYRLINDFGVYVLRDPDYVDEGGFMGPCLTGEYRVLGKDNWQVGSFRVDRIESLDPIPEQLEMGTEAA